MSKKVAIMQPLKYNINNKSILVEVPIEQKYESDSKNIILSNKENDITFSLPWFVSEDFLSDFEFKNMLEGISETVKHTIENELHINTDGFSLEKYHNYVRSDDDHYKVVSKTRELYPRDFNFPIEKMIPKFEKMVGFNLTDCNEVTGEIQGIIIRINRPNSNDYNPPHKDMYEDYDKGIYKCNFLNFWVPVAGVTDKSSLPLVESSHLIPENKVVRTKTKSIVGKNTYRVRFVKEWGGNSLIRSDVKYGQVLLFSPHLIHGLAVNEQDDVTRLALEFRLFKK